MASLSDIQAGSAGMQDVTRGAHTPSRPPGLVAAWLILVSAGSTSVIYNVWHAVHNGSMNPALALLYGFMPVFLAALVSHIVAEADGGPVMKVAAVVIMLVAMGLSMGATAAVVHPAAGAWMQWLFGGLLDGATLVALRVILDSRSRKNKAAMEMEAARAEVQAALAQAREGAGERTRLEAELKTVKSDGAKVQGELEAQVQALTSALNKARNRTRGSGPKRQPASARNSSAGSPLKTDVPSDVDTQAEALRILSEDPDISGGELGRRLGKSERYGCMLKNRLAGSVADPEAGQ